MIEILLLLNVMTNLLHILTKRVRWFMSSIQNYVYLSTQNLYVYAETRGQHADERNITLDDIKHAYALISPYMYKTPVIEYVDENKNGDKRFFFKCENMQRTGSFKLRGALYATLQYVSNNCNNAHGLVTFSSGNHGLALAMAAKLVGLKCVVVTQKTTPASKIAAIGLQEYGAEILFCDKTVESGKSLCKEIQDNRNYHYVSTSDDYDVIIGQATLGLEFLSQVPDLDAILVTVSGGGLAAGTCLATKYVKPECKVFAAEPPGKDLEMCLRAEKRLWPNPPRCLDTVAEGLLAQQISHKNWPILLNHLQRDVFTVSDDDSIRGVQFAFEKLKLVIEPSAGTAVAAALSEKMRNMPGLRNIGVVLCGGNVDLNKLPEFLNKYQVKTF